MIQIKSRDMDFQHTVLLVACFSLLTSSFSVHANLILPRRFGDVTPYYEETLPAVSSSSSASSPNSAPAPPPHHHLHSISISKTPVSTEGEISAPSPPEKKGLFSSLLKAIPALRAREASLGQESVDSIATSGLRSADAGDEILSTASADVVSAVKAAAAAAGSGSVDPKVFKFCAITDNPDVCINSILPFVRSASAGQVDPMNILDNEIKAGIKEAKKTINRLAVVAASHDIADQMSTCKENYKNVLKSFKDASAAVTRKDLGRITSVLSGAITYIGTCDDAFAEKPTIHSPLGPHFAARLKDLTGICLEIVNKWVPDDH